jgi:predicted N-acetyltransferase YhbS
MKIEYLADNTQFVPIVCDWFHEEWSYLNPSRTEQQLYDVVESRLTKGVIPTILIATENNELVGTVTLRNDEVEEETTLYPWLSSLYVAKNRRHKGVGELLTKACIEEANKNGFDKLYLFTDKEKLKKWYMKMGWKDLKTINHRSVPIDILFYEQIDWSLENNDKL